MAKKLTGLRRLWLAIAVVVVILLGGWWLSNPTPEREPAVAGPARGGALVATVRSEPRSFNRFVARDRTSDLVSLLVHEKLVHTNLATQQMEPALAESWTPTEDGKTWTVRLREGVKFSDGTAFTSADVLFSLRAVYDAKTASPLGGALSVDDKPLSATAPDAHTLVVTFPSRFGPGLRLLDNLPILPEHKLGTALANGTLADEWGLTTPLTEMVGLGPFVVSEYRPGERLVLARNPHYWRRDADGQPLPRLDRLTLMIVPDQNAELLRLEAGETDLISDEVPPEDLAAMKRAAAAGRVQLFDVGVGLEADFLWFDLKTGPPSPSWLKRRELRQAISLAVDRHAFADTVYLGAAVPIAGPVTPGNRDWFDPTLPVPTQDVARARRLLAAIGLADKNGDGQLETPEGTPARFALLTQKGHAQREKGAAFIQQDLAKLGLGVDIVTLEVPALIDRVTRGDYQAAYFGVQASDTDPATNLDYWLSSGAFHPWNPGQTSPASEWEARIDTLMHQQVASTDQAERRRIFNEVQHIFVDELPAIYFAAPRVSLVTSARVANVHAGLLQPYVLWDAATLGVR